MASSRKSNRSSRVHNLSSARKKTIKLPVQVTRVQENQDPIELENPFTIHPLSEFNNTEESVLKEESSPGKFLLKDKESFQPVTNESFLHDQTPVLSNNTSVLNLPSSQMDGLEMDNFKSESLNQEEVIAEQKPLSLSQEEVATEQKPFPEADQLNPKDLIKVNFGTFVELVASQDVEKILEQHANQELIMSTNLLTKLASLRDNREEKKIPLVFLVGIAIGVVLTYIFFSSAG